MGIWQKNFSTVLFLWKNFKNYLKYKHTSCFVLDKGNVRQGTQREFFCFISWGFFSEVLNLSLAPSAIIGWPLQYSLLLCLEKPHKNTAKVDVPRTNTVLFQPELHFNISETKKSQHLDFSFGCPWILFSNFSSQSQKASQSVALCFSTEETAKHFCDAIYVNS